MLRHRQGSKEVMASVLSETPAHGRVLTVVPCRIASRVYRLVVAGSRATATNRSDSACPAVAMRAFSPGVGPRRHATTVVLPSQFVRLVGASRAPPPATTVNVTGSPGIGL